MDRMEKEGETMKRILVSALALSLFLVIAGPASAGDVGQIGRASCRERV